MKTIFSSFLILLNLLLINCQPQKMEHKFKWLGTISAPKEYPINVYEGAIIAEGFTYNFDHMWGGCNTGWGNGCGTMSVATEQMAVPDSLSFTWYSIVENKFYSGKWELPHQQMSQLFTEGFIDDFSGKKETYTTIIIGLAPKGKLTVWLGAPGQQVEVTFLQAKEITLTRDQVYMDFKYIFEDNYRESFGLQYIKPEVQAKIEKEGYPDPAIYETYRKRYSWRPILKVNDLDSIKFYNTIMYNGEMETLRNEYFFTPTYKSRAIPKDFGFLWFDKEGKEYVTKVKEFNEKEIFKIFETLGSQKPIDFVVELKDKTAKPRVYFTNHTDTLEIKNTPIINAQIE